MMALQLLLKVALERGVQQFQVFGDLALVINWMKEIFRLILFTCSLWLIILKRFLDFLIISLSHVYRQHNAEADVLSKDGQQLEAGVIILEVFGQCFDSVNAACLTVPYFCIAV
jgi:hypothetical protein